MTSHRLQRCHWCPADLMIKPGTGKHFPELLGRKTRCQAVRCIDDVLDRKDHLHGCQRGCVVAAADRLAVDGYVADATPALRDKLEKLRHRAKCGYSTEKLIAAYKARYPADS